MMSAKAAPPDNGRQSDAASSAGCSFDFIVNPSVTNHRSRHQRALQSSPVNCYFLDSHKQKYQYQRWRSCRVNA